MKRHIHVFKLVSVYLLLLFLPFCILAQNGSIKGQVKDSSSNPIAYASLIIREIKISSASDEKGNYELKNIPAGNYSLSISCMGYAAITKRVSVRAGEGSVIDFELSPKSKELNEVVVSGTINKSGMGHLDEEHDGIIYAGKKNEVLIIDSIDANTAQNNPRQVLGRVPGSNYSETEGGGFPANGIGFRGLNPTQSKEINTRQDGYNITADIYGYPESYYLPPLEAVERIEIIRGASSLQFGPQFGGVVNYIISAGPKDKAFEFTTQQTGGSFGFYNSFNSIGGSYKKWNYYSFVQYKNIEGWRPNSEVSQLTGFAKAEYQATDNFKIGLEYSLLRNKIHMPGGLDDGEFNHDPRQSFRARNWLTTPWNILALTMQYKINDKMTLSFKSTGNISERNIVWRNEDGGPQAPDSINHATNSYAPREVEHEGFKNSTNEFRLLTNYTISGINQTLAAGIRYFYGSMQRRGGGPGSTGVGPDLNLYGGEYGYDLNFTTTNIAPFIENAFHIGKYVSIIPGFRFEHLKSTANGYITDDSAGKVTVNTSKSWNIPLAGVGTQIKTSHSTNIYANISQAYKPVDYSSITPIGVASKIDPNLRDASGYNADLGWRGTIHDYLNFDIGGFYLAYNNHIGIELLTDANGHPYTYRTNVANSVNKGIETYIEINPVKMLGQGSKIGTLSFFNSFAMIDAHYTNGIFKGKLVEFAPQYINHCGATYAYKRFSTTFTISNTAKSYTDANNTVFSPDAIVGLIPAYMVMDWSATVKIKNYNIKFGVNNLSDVRYFTFRTDEYPGPGIIPGIGRSFYLGLGAKF